MDAPEDDVYIYVPSVSRAARADLYVARTRLMTANGIRYDFYGLFCHNVINQGEFIGMYSGSWIHPDDVPFEWGNRYALELTNVAAVVSPPGQRPDPASYPIAMANEPLPNTPANAGMIESRYERDELECVPNGTTEQHFYGIGLFACTRIPARTEIRWFYGASYAAMRDYEEGEPCEATPTETPLQRLGHPIPYHAVTPMIDSPSASCSESQRAEFTLLSRRLLGQKSEGFHREARLGRESSRDRSSFSARASTRGRATKPRQARLLRAS